MIDTTFELLGWHVDYYINRKFIGSKLVPKPDRERYGYEGRVQKELKEDIVLRNKKYKKGTLVVTECVPLCGRLLGDCFKVLEDRHEWRNEIRAYR